MTARATPTASVLNDPANQMICSTYRRNLIACLNGHVFTKEERERGVANAKACEDPAQLARWLKNTKERANQREVEDVDASDDDELTYQTLDTSY